MLKLTANELRNSLPALASLVTEKIHGNPRLAYNLAKTWKSVKAEAEAIRDQELALYKSFGATEQDGAYKLEVSELEDERRSDFDRQLSDLYSFELEVWGDRITLAEIEQAKIDMTPAHCEALSWLIAEPEGEAAAKG